MLLLLPKLWLFYFIYSPPHPPVSCGLGEMQFIQELDRDGDKLKD